MLVEPDGVSVLANELILAHAVDGGRAADLDLLAPDENGHKFLFASLLFRSLGWFELFLRRSHGE